MKVSVWGRDSTLGRARDAGLTGTASLTSLFAENDVVSLHLRLNDATRGLVKSEHLAAMRPDALIVNTSRAELIEPGALERALSAGRPGSAAVDVYESEPVLKPGHPLAALCRTLAAAVRGDRKIVEQDFGDAFDAVDAKVRRRQAELGSTVKKGEASARAHHAARRRRRLDHVLESGALSTR